jgi:hypothetical protein
MWDYIENVHLSKVLAEQRPIYHHPVYKAQGLVLDYIKHFKNYVARVHKINLRP